MKLQLSPGIIRLRLADDEVREFDQAGQLVHRLPLGLGPAQSFAFALVRLPRTAPAAELQARYTDGELRVELPEPAARAWAGSGVVSVKGAVVGTDGQEIRIVVEKDLGPSH